MTSVVHPQEILKGDVDHRHILVLLKANRRASVSQKRSQYNARVSVSYIVWGFNALSVAEGHILNVEACEGDTVSVVSSVIYIVVKYHQRSFLRKC